MLTFRDATLKDVPVIAALHNAAAGALTARHGEGRWSSFVTERGTAASQRHARVRVGKAGKRIITVLRLARKKPWAIDVSYFTPVKRPLYLTGMTVAVTHQGQGLGRLALDDAVRIARGWPADAIRLDAFDADAGAGSFYAKCGFVERGRVVYKGDPLIYYELLLA
ncbi:MAG TPA: GNAT family N-acetyltransferase [Gemmatimonadaceae bacterium]|nr:GNAT family N-acetyltransferase [Gemmatimonadaceae bacterium]